MKKKCIFTVLFAFVVMTGWAQTKNYTINGNLAKMAKVMSKAGLSLDSVTIVDIVTSEVMARQNIQNGLFTISGAVDKPLDALIYFWSSLDKNGEKEIEKIGLPIIIEPGTIECNSNGIISTIPNISGTPLNNVLLDAQSKIHTSGYIDYCKQLIAQHKDDPAGIYLLLLLDSTVVENSETILSLINQLSESSQRHPRIIEAKEKALAIMSSPKVGDKFKDFTVEYEGQQQRLSDYVGRGKYVLVNFWTSWFGPCKQEIPNLIKMWNKYKGDKFEVLGVATWDKPELTKKSIKDLGIPYPQILNVQKAETDIYGIEAIPEIILFDPDGVIIARGLRGANIEKTLEENLE